MRIRRALLIKGSTAACVRQKILGFSERYRHYRTKEHKSPWTLHLISSDNGKCVVQLVEQSFEPARGRVASDAPYIVIDLAQKGEAVHVGYCLKWKKWKAAVIAFAMAVHLAAACVMIFHRSLFEPVQRFSALALWVCLLAAFIRWLIKNVRHDHLTMKVFGELLQKNFDNIQWER